VILIFSLRLGAVFTAIFAVVITRIVIPILTAILIEPS
jgi:hypothetical protein